VLNEVFNTIFVFFSEMDTTKKKKSSKEKKRELEFVDKAEKKKARSESAPAPVDKGEKKRAKSAPQDTSAPGKGAPAAPRPSSTAPRPSSTAPKPSTAPKGSLAPPKAATSKTVAKVARNPTKDVKAKGTAKLTKGAEVKKDKPTVPMSVDRPESVTFPAECLAQALDKTPAKEKKKKIGRLRKDEILRTDYARAKEL